MVDVFGGSGSFRGLHGKRGPPGAIGPPGKRGKNGENSGYYSQYFQHSKTEWDIDFEPNFWIDGYDVQEQPTFKLLNKHDHKYDGTSSSSKPIKGTDLRTGRHVVTFNGSQYITCPMDWNGTKSLDNLQVFIVFKFNNIEGEKSSYRGALFGNESGGNKWRFVALTDWAGDNTTGRSLIIGGNERDALYISSFPSDANPVQTETFNVLSVHWNNKGESGCGTQKSAVYCNGKRIASFTARPILDNPTFTLGAEGPGAHYNLKGDIGRLLVCGNREHVMDEEEIIVVHKYLMEEWKINEKARKRGPRGPAGPKGDKGDAGDRGLQGTRGLRGEKGDAGAPGKRGERGVKGPRGNDGERGPQGEKGDRGNQGVQGERGPRGIRGPKCEPSGGSGGDGKSTLSFLVLGIKR